VTELGQMATEVMGVEKCVFCIYSRVP